MADEKDPRIITPLPPSMVQAIDDYRFKHRLPSRAEAIRRLLSHALALDPAVRTLLARRTGSGSDKNTRLMDEAWARVEAIAREN